MTYKILVSTDDEYLANNVNDHIKQGWTPTGGLAMNGKYIAQAMTKEK